MLFSSNVLINNLAMLPTLASRLSNSPSCLEIIVFTDQSVQEISRIDTTTLTPVDRSSSETPRCWKWGTAGRCSEDQGVNTRRRRSTACWRTATYPPPEEDCSLLRAGSDCPSHLASTKRPPFTHRHRQMGMTPMLRRDALPYMESILADFDHSQSNQDCFLT